MTSLVPTLVLTALFVLIGGAAIGAQLVVVITGWQPAGCDDVRATVARVKLGER